MEVHANAAFRERLARLPCLPHTAALVLTETLCRDYVPLPEQQSEAWGLWAGELHLRPPQMALTTLARQGPWD